MRAAQRKTASAGLVGVVIASALGALVFVSPGARAVTFFLDTFDPAPMPGWFATPGAWHVADDTADACFGTAPPNHPAASASSPNSWGYHFDTAPPARPGLECTYDLDNGAGGSAANSGGLTSPTIDLTLSGPTVWLHFSTWRQTEGGSFYDQMTVWLDLGGGPFQVFQLLNPPSPQTAWDTIDVDISLAAGSATVNIIFMFDTIDEVGNQFAGWYVDDVLVDDVAPPPDLVIFTPFSLAPPTVMQGDANVLMAAVDIDVNASDAQVDGITLDLSGMPPADADIASVEVWLDDGDLFFDPFFDMWLGANFFTGGTTSVMWPPFTVFTGVPERLWITYNIAPGATVGDWVGVSIVDATYLNVLAPDTTACMGCPFDTYNPPAQTQILAATVDTLTFAPLDMAPMTVFQGDTMVLMAGIDVSVDNNSADIIGIVVNLTGVPPADADVAIIFAWLDDGDLVFIPFADMPVGIGFFAGGTAPLFMFGPVTVNAGFPERLWVSYDIAPGATPGNFVGLSMVDQTFMVVAPPDLVVCSGCPFDTFVPVNKTEILAAPIDTLTVTLTDLAPPTAAQGDLNVLMASLGLSVDNNSATLETVTVTLTGMPPLDTDISNVGLWMDNGDLVFNPGPDFPVAFGGFVFGQAALFPFAPVTAGNQTLLWLTYDIALGATVGDWVGAAIPSATNFTVTAPDLVVCAGCPFDTYMPLSKTQITPPTVDNLTFTPFDMAPLTVQPGDLALMGGMNLTVDANTADVTAITVNLTGFPPVDADVGAVIVLLDNGDGVFSILSDTFVGFGFFAGLTTTIFPFFPLTVTAGTPVTLWIAYGIAMTATVGDFVGLDIDSDANVVVNPPDLVSCVGCPMDTYLAGTKTEIVNQTIDNVTFTPVDLAPPTVLPGDTQVLMAAGDLSVDQNTAVAISVTVNLTGLPPVDGDVTGVTLWVDDGDLVFNPLLDIMGPTQPFGGLTTTFFLGLLLTAGTPARLWFTYDIAPGATVGDFVGTFFDAMSLGVLAPDASLCVGCPFDTYVNGTKTRIGSVIPGDTLTFQPFDLAPVTVLPGDTNVLMGMVFLTVDSNDTLVTSVTLDLTGLPPLDADVSQLTLWQDNGDAAFSPLTDSVLNSGAFTGGTMTFSTAFFVTAPTPRRLWVTYDIAPGATPGDWIGFSMVDSTYVTALAPDSVVCFGCPLDTYVNGTKTLIASVANLPPEAQNLLVDGFLPASAGILHILSANPTFDWTYYDPEAALQTDYEVRVGTGPGLNDMWAPGPAGGPGLTDVYGGAALVDATDYYFAVRVHDGTQWSPWNETLFHTNGIPPAPTLLAPPDMSVLPANPTQTTQWSSGGPDPDGDPVTYYWQVATDALFTNIISAWFGPGTTSNLATVPGTTYYWRVRTGDGWEYSAWSAWQFTTNSPPEAQFPGVDGFLDATVGILHILSGNPALNWTFFDLDALDVQTDYEIRVGTAPGLNDMWAPGPQVGGAMTVGYAGAALALATDYYFGVHVRDGLEWSNWTEVRFQLNGIPPPPMTPVNPPPFGSVGYGPATTVDWTSGGPDPNGDAVTYFWEVSTDPTFTTVNYSGSGPGLISTPFNTDPLMSYYWRAQACDAYGCSAWSTWQFDTTGVVANLRPLASFPGVDGFLNATVGILHILSSAPAFNWTYSDPDSDPQAWFQVRVGTAPGLGDVWAPGPQAGAATTATYAGPTLVDGMDYYFEVRVNDSMDWSLPWEYVLFHTNTPPPAPDLLTPADGSTGISAGSVGLTWNASVDLDGDTVTYDWQVSTSATFAVIFASGTSSTTSATVTGALAGTQYFWRVRAHDGWEYGNYSATWDFSIASPPPPPPPTTGNITVHIVDSSGADISGATVELRNATGAVVATLTTNATGRVTFPGRAFGSYTARVTKTGYQEGLSAVIPLSLGNLNPSVDVTLQATITQPQPAPFPWWILALIAIVVAVVLLLLLFMRRRRKPQEEVPPAGGAQVPTTLPAAPPAGEIPGQAPATPGGRESAAPAISEISVVSPQGAAAPGQGPTVTPPTAPAAGPDIQARLAKLDQLKAKGLIDEATYQQKRRELLGQ